MNEWIEDDCIDSYKLVQLLQMSTGNKKNVKQRVQDLELHLIRYVRVCLT
jgi:hypothetical protein